jgi:phosphoribosyl-ATP pyrophosphohydrolase
MSAVLTDLEATIRSRRGGDASSSYVAKLFAAGRPKIAQKVGEEAVETVIAALSGDAAAVTGEAADLLFHLIVLLADCGVSIEAVLDELRRREGLSGLAEKAARAAD